MYVTLQKSESDRRLASPSPVYTLVFMANNNNIFVPQTFNGARMVNVTKRTPTAPPTSSDTAPADATTATTHNASPPSSSEHKRDSKPDISAVNASPKAKAIAIKPYASSQSVIDTRANKSPHTSRASTSSSAKPPIVAPSPLQHLDQHQHHQQHQQRQQHQAAAAAAAAATPIPAQPTRIISPPHMQHPQAMLQPSTPGPYDVVGYERAWSEANVAVLIQLHRKHYNGVTSVDGEQQNAAWAALTSEYNAITADNRSTLALTDKWARLMAKYNVERAFLVMPRAQGLQQPVTASYWSHFQYMDNYLSHVPIPENCVLQPKRRVAADHSDEHGLAATTTAKRPRTTTATTAAATAAAATITVEDLNMELLETHRVLMEKTLDKQDRQIEMMKANAESMHEMMKMNAKSMHEMNMKFASICEMAYTKSQTNEERYLNLLEEHRVLSNTKKAISNELATTAEQEQQTKEASPGRPDSPTLSPYLSASSEPPKADVEEE
ncbi:hypothetical protein MBANPS3_009380 [Mucor bainieri]